MRALGYFCVGWTLLSCSPAAISDRSAPSAHDTGGASGASAASGGSTGEDLGHAGSSVQGSGGFSMSDAAPVEPVADATPMGDAAVLGEAAVPMVEASTPACAQEPIAKPPSNDWTFALGTAAVVPNGAGVPTYTWILDGHMPALALPNKQWALFWAEWENYRTVGSTPYPEDHTMRSPSGKVSGGRGGEGNSWDNNGLWLMSVLRTDSSKIVGFYHAEDSVGGGLWKSMSVTYSTDDGVTWSKNQQIISTPKVNGMQGGNGDGSAVWDKCAKRWVMFYQHSYLTAAMSIDPLAAAGTWKKYYNGDFIEPGLGGNDSPFDTSPQLAGPSPSVHFNTYLGQWIMVYAGWNPNPNTYISSSLDLIHWTPPRLLAQSMNTGKEAWYPVIIGSGGDTVSGQAAHLYYADTIGSGGARKFMGRTITFQRND
jgi:hypothetical protein